MKTHVPCLHVARTNQIKALKDDYQIIMWNQLSGDFDQNLNRKKSLASLCKNAKPGNIVVFHDSMKAFENIKEILINNYNIAPTLSSRYGTYIQFLKYKYKEKPFMIGFVLFLKIFNFKYIIFRLILLFDRR